MAQATISQQLTKLNLFRNLLLESKCISKELRLLRNKSTKVKTASSVYHSMNIFDRKAKILQKERSAQNEDYHLVEYIKEEVGWRTADRVFDIKRTFKNAVELGACRGYVSRHFLPDSVEKVTLCDTSQTHLDKALVGEGVKVEKVIMDEENIDPLIHEPSETLPTAECSPVYVTHYRIGKDKAQFDFDSVPDGLSIGGQFPDNSVDLIVSSLALHWVNDLPGCFDKIMKCLQPDGVFMATVFGGDTLMELRQSLQLAETERLGGVFPHISPFTRIRDIGGLLNASGFTLQTVDVDSLTIWYPSAWEIMRDVRALGEGNAAHNRPLRLNKDVQFAAAAIYEEMYGKEVPDRKVRGVPATFQIINFLGWKPDPTQPKPIERGTGEMSLKDLHRIDEIIKDTKKVELRDEDMK